MLNIILNKSEIGAGTRGSALGVDAIRYASFPSDIDFFNNVLELENLNNCLWDDFEQKDFPNARFIKELNIFYSKHLSFLSEKMKAGSRSLILSADHSSSALYLAAMKKSNPDSRIGVVWIDAHSDLHSPYTSPSGNMHGMTLANALGIDNQEIKRRQINKRTKKYWDDLKNFSGKSPIISPQDLVYIGLRDIQKEESAIINQKRIKTYYSRDILNADMKIIAKDTLAHLNHCGQIFISFDVDSMDPDSVSKGTGTPVIGGLNFQQTIDLIDTLTKDNKVSAFEITEINPLLDNQNQMAEVAFKILKSVAKNFT